MLPGWDKQASPYHEGETRLHARLGRAEQQERMARRIHRPYLPQQHRDFFAALPFLVAGSVDAQGWPWASVLFGEPGFARSPDERVLRVRAEPVAGDPLQGNLLPGAPIGLVGVELGTRRRNRMNGVVDTAVPGTFDISVVQSFGNCPQYIQTRAMRRIEDRGASFTPVREHFTSFSEEAATMLRRADTFFVASYNDRDDPLVNGGADVNHRGGRPGFIKVDGDTLTIPDYIGNFAFNTFGNLLVNPKAGLLFIDFDSGDLWQLTGRAELLWEPDEQISAFRGAERAWRFTLAHGHRLVQAAPLRWDFGEFSPNSRLTGNWDEAQQVLAANADRNAWRPYRVARIEAESSLISSFHLEPLDGMGSVNYKPGQHLSLRIAPGESSQSLQSAPWVRHYTLSSAPADAGYRLSIKRESGGDVPDGVVSTFMHASLSRGDRVQIRAPRGDFWLDTASKRPAALFAAGVGITPMISMARQVVSEGLSRRHQRPLTVVHAARRSAERAFAGEFAGLAAAGDGSLRYLSLIAQPLPDERAGRDFHASGRLTRDIVQEALPGGDPDCYLCGPPAFMQAVYGWLLELGVPDERIHAESFGPSSLRRVAAVVEQAPAIAVSKPEAVVAFERSGIERGWSPADGSLLELAEAQGLSPAHGCRAGACGLCAVRLLAGQVRYPEAPALPPPAGRVLVCCSVPEASAGTLRLDL